MNEQDFKNNFENLDFDISHIDIKLDSINKNIILLQNNIDRITNLLINTKNPQDRIKIYEIQSNALKTLALFDDNYHRLLDLKYKYRTEQDDLSIKSKRLVFIELVKINKEIEDESHIELMKKLSALSAQKTDLSFDFKDDELI